MANIVSEQYADGLEIRIRELTAQLAAAEARVAERDAVLRAVERWAKNYQAVHAAYDAGGHPEGVATVRLGESERALLAAFQAARSVEVQDGK